MAAGGMSRDIQSRWVTSVLGNVSIGPGDSRARLPRDVGDGDLRAKIVFDDNDGRAAINKDRDKATVVVFAAAAPVAAVDIDENWASRLGGRIDVQNLTR